MPIIITPGKRPEDEWYHTTCSSCRTHFKFRRGEARCSGDQRDPGYTITCPFCSKSVWLNNLTKYQEASRWQPGDQRW
jgi:LSD1 subclass zinc finger protein